MLIGGELHRFLPKYPVQSGAPERNVWLPNKTREDSRAHIITPIHPSFLFCPTVPVCSISAHMNYCCM